MVDKRLRLELESTTAYRAARQEEPERLERALALPDGFNPRARAVAERWRTLAPAARIDEALRFFGRQGLQYTLAPPLYGRDAVDDFVFDGRQGFCEHFAGAFVFMLRAAGLPARVVGGYQGGEDNGGYLIVRQADAHAWAEVWLEGEGWRRVDPTFAVAPAASARASPRRSTPASCPT
ncbi:transglutaminase-like domain-containing protein [Chitinimonas koreensis]|uniref:transglutaminase-like domain-containing protein n=1 Tax=Chitinimonas koreensis TaxID=356302 RepID=UPI0035714837